MKTRCNNPKTPYFHNYGGRGIAVCERWNRFENFLADMGECPAGYSLERKRVNGNYTPDNCIWIPTPDQTLNQRKTIAVILDGKSMPACRAARLLGVPWWGLLYRVKKYGQAHALKWAEAQQNCVATP